MEAAVKRLFPAACLAAPLLLLSACQSPSTGGASGPAEVRHLAAADFTSFTRTPDKLLVVDFYADWCGPCKMLSPILERAAGSFPGKVVIGKINVDEAQTLAGDQGVRSIPDVRIYRDGKEVERFVGVLGESEIRSLLAKHTQGLPDAATPATATPKKEPSITPATKGDKTLPPGVERR